MKGMEGRAGTKTVYTDRAEEEAAVEGYAADVSMVGGKEDVPTPVKQVKQILSAAGSGNNADITTPLTKKQKQSKSNATPAKSAETPATSARPHSSTRPRFTAPSALPSLPSNMFVTSVYFPWPHGKKGAKAKNRVNDEQEPETSFAVEESAMEVDEEAAAALKRATPSVESIASVTTASVAHSRASTAQIERERKRRAYLLGREYIPPDERYADEAEYAEEAAVDEQIHGAMQNGNPHPQNAGSLVTVVDWEHAERDWDELKVISADNLEQLVEGTILAWKVSLPLPVIPSVSSDTALSIGPRDGLRYIYTRNQGQARPSHGRETLDDRHTGSTVSDSSTVSAGY